MVNEGKEEKHDHWQRIEEIYYAALSVAADERPALVAQLCAGDDALQAEVGSLLAADEVMTDFLQVPVAELGMAVLAGGIGYDPATSSRASYPASVELVGTKIANRYEVINKLGSGGFGEVYKAADTKILSRPVVIKVLKDDVIREEGRIHDWVVTKFQQEIEALSKIHDSGVVGIFDADTLPDGRPYIVMEFVEGTDLRQFIKQNRPEHTLEQRYWFNDVAEIIKQAGRTLTAAHDAGIFHRDLKPENILLRYSAGRDFQVKVIDFGVAKVRNSLIASSAMTEFFVAGTWHYMSPEQLQGKKVSAACDIYALGVIAYEMIAGRHPFAAKDRGQLKDLQAAGVRVKPCDLNPDLPASAQEVILKALSYLPGERYKRARDFSDELARSLATNEELAGPLLTAPVDPEDSTVLRVNEIAQVARREPIITGPQPAPASRPSRRRRWLFSIAAVLLVGLIGFMIWRELSKGPERTLTYWLTMQRSRDAKPFDSTGERVFDSGSRCWFNVQTIQSGALYLFGQGHDKNGPSQLNTMFPTLRSGNGNARLEADRNGPVTQAPYEFRNDNGVIYLWIIWSTQPVVLLDDIVKKSYETGGTITDLQHQTELRNFIEQHKNPEPELITDNQHFRLTLKGRSEILVSKMILEYQP